MVTFKDFINYFEQLAQSHADILHDPAPNGRRSFFNVDIVDIIAGFKSTVPHNKYLLILVNYNSLLDESKPSEKEIMFFVMKDQKKGDINANNDIRSEAEEIAGDIIAKIKEDCTALPRDPQMNKMFGGSMDSIKGVSIIHTEFTAAAQKLIGVQVSFTNKFNYCAKVRPGKFN